MIAKKRKTANKKRQPKQQVELPKDIPVKLVPDPPKVSRIEAVRRGLWRLLLFLAGLTPTTIFAFQIIVLRPDHVDPSVAFVILMLTGLAISFAVANVSDDKLSKSGKEIVPLVRGVLRSKTGTTSENRIVVEDK